MERAMCIGEAGAEHEPITPTVYLPGMQALAASYKKKFSKVLYFLHYFFIYLYRIYILTDQFINTYLGMDQTYTQIYFDRFFELHTFTYLCLPGNANLINLFLKKCIIKF